jgi:hypothetical protein
MSEATEHRAVSLGRRVGDAEREKVNGWTDWIASNATRENTDDHFIANQRVVPVFVSLLVLASDG